MGMETRGQLDRRPGNEDRAGLEMEQGLTQGAQPALDAPGGAISCLHWQRG